MAENFFANAAEEAKRVPWWGWVLGGGAVLLVGSHLLGQNSGTGTASADAAGTSGGDGVGDIGSAGPPPAPGGTGTGGSGTSGTTVTQLRLTKATSWNQIANEQVGGNVAWLKSWNHQLANQPSYNKPWQTLPAGTVVNIPHEAGSSAGGSSGTSGSMGTSSGGGSKTVVVKAGDTLQSIANANHVDEGALFALNSTLLDQTAKSHGFANSDQGHWIFPGEVLKIPA